MSLSALVVLSVWAQTPAPGAAPALRSPRTRPQDAQLDAAGALQRHRRRQTAFRAGQ